MSRIYVGNVDSRAAERDLEDEFRMYGVLRRPIYVCLDLLWIHHSYSMSSVWVARKPPGFAFVEFEDRRDANDAIRALDGKNGWRVELARSSGGGGGGGGPRGGGGRPRGRGDGGGGGGGRGGEETKCYECGEAGHFARECRLRVGAGGLGNGARARSRSPRYRRSPSYGHSPRGRSPGSHGQRRSRSPAGARQVVSPQREQSLSQSPPPRRQSYKESSPANGNGKTSRDRRSERSVSP